MAVPTPFFRQDSHSLVILWGLDPTHSMEEMAMGICTVHNFADFVFPTVLGPSFQSEAKPSRHPTTVSCTCPKRICCQLCCAESLQGRCSTGGGVFTCAAQWCRCGARTWSCRFRVQIDNGGETPHQVMSWVRDLLLGPQSHLPVAVPGIENTSQAHRGHSCGWVA